MSFRSIAITAVCATFGFTIVDAAIAGHLQPATLNWYHGGVRAALLLLVAVCAGAAAPRLHWWSEYFGRVWTLFCGSYLILAASEIARRVVPDSAIANALVIAANVALVVAYWMMARALHTAGLQYYGSRTNKILFVSLAFLLAAALCFGAFAGELASIRSAAPDWGGIVSTLADFITFLLIAPLLLTTMALRGGQLFWIFAMLAVGTFGWMVNQGAATILHAASLDPLIRSGRMFGFALACFFISGAAVAQWLASRPLPQEAAHA